MLVSGPPVLAAARPGTAPGWFPSGRAAVPPMRASLQVRVTAAPRQPLLRASHTTGTRLERLTRVVLPLLSSAVTPACAHMHVVYVADELRWSRAARARVCPLWHTADWPSLQLGEPCFRVAPPGG